MMNKLSALVVVLSMASLANAMIVWDHWSPLSVTETITDYGDYYLYEYSLVNVDTSPIWDFGVYTDFATGDDTSFTKLGWTTVDTLIYGIEPEYDARNLNANILMVTGTTCFNAPGNEIQVGETASGFSFTTSTFDPLPKYYFYETIASGYTQTNGTGKVAAVGLTVPEPGTVLLLGLGSLALLRKRKRG